MVRHVTKSAKNTRQAIDPSRSHAIKARPMKRHKKVRIADDGPWHLVTATDRPPGVGDFEQLAARRDATRSGFIQIIDELGNEGYFSVERARRVLTYERHEDGRRIVVSDAALKAMVLERRIEVDQMGRMGHVWPLDVPGALALNKRALEANARALGDRVVDLEKRRLREVVGHGAEVREAPRKRSDKEIGRDIKEAKARGDVDAAWALVEELEDEGMRELAAMHIRGFEF